jgi:hypothetical protein
MSINYNYEIAKLGLPPIVDERQLQVHDENRSSPSYQTDMMKRQQATIDYVKEAEQQHKPMVDLYNVANAPGIGDLSQKILAGNGMKAYRLGPDTMLIHTHHSPHD